jgi:hypothetical protein
VLTATCIRIGERVVASGTTNGTSRCWPAPDPEVTISLATYSPVTQLVPIVTESVTGHPASR